MDPNVIIFWHDGIQFHFLNHYYLLIHELFPRPSSRTVASPVADHFFRFFVIARHKLT